MDERVSVLVLGEGPEAKRHATAWRTQGDAVDVTVVSTDDADDVLAQRNGTAPKVASVCVPPSRRVALTASLLGLGHHVLLPTPAGVSLEAARTLDETARRVKRFLVPGNVLLYTPAMRRLMAYVYARRLGAVQNVYSYRYGPASERLPFEPEDWTPDWELAAQASLVKHLCLMNESRVADRTFATQGGDLWLTATMYYPDDILSSVRVDPEVQPTRRGLMVTFAEGVLQWEADAQRDRLVLRRKGRERNILLDSDDPYTAMAGALLRAVQGRRAPYQDGQAVLKGLALEESWRD